MRTLGIGLLMTAVAIAGCGGPDRQPAGGAAAGGAGTITVAFVTNNASDFWKIAQAGTEKAAGELGCDVLFKIPPQGTAQEQKQIVQDLITRGVTGIAISPKDPENQTALLNETAAQVNLVTQDSDAPNSNRICYIGTDNYQAGVAAGMDLEMPSTTVSRSAVRMRASACSRVSPCTMILPIIES